MATKRDEPSLIQQRIHSKREEPSQSQLKMASRKEDSSPAQLKMASRKEEPSPGQLKMANKKEDPSVLQQRMASKREDREPSQGHQGDVAAAAAPGSLEHQNSRSGNTVLKSGPLFLSSKGIGWTSWKKRWFILTHTSLVFFRSDPNAVSQKGNEVNLTLGGIDLNNSGSVIVKADKKLITVQFQDGPDGRTFTLKAETLDDLYEWKAALENALSQAPSSANAMGQNGIFRNDQSEEVDASKEPANDKPPVRSTVIGRPVLLALEDVDGAPTFLEKALKFIEKHGVRVEGILRQAADVEDVKRRIQEYEQGKTEFSSEEDAHVIGDCVKYILRELPSSPVPASCCNALLEACRTQRGSRVNAMRLAVLDTFPEPNRHLLQRILMMMQVVASHKNENLMSTSAVAACMAPLLLRPLLAGDCEIETDFDVGGDGSMQLLQAAAAANHAQAIVITLLEEYDQIFGVLFPLIYTLIQKRVAVKVRRQLKMIVSPMTKMNLMKTMNAMMEQKALMYPMMMMRMRMVTMMMMMMVMQQVKQAVKVVTLLPMMWMLIRIHKLFDQIPQPNAFLWTALIHGYVENRNYLEALSLFSKMREDSVLPLKFTLASVLKSLARLVRVKDGEAVYGLGLKCGFCFDLIMQNAVIDLFMRCGEVDLATRVFDEMEEKDLVSWNSMISGYGNNGRVNLARKLFDEMLERNVISWTSMIQGYFKAGEKEEAKLLFDRMTTKDLASWNVMVSGYMDVGDVHSAQSVFEAMPVRDAGTWNLMISGFCKAGKMEVAKEFFDKMPSKNFASWTIMVDGYVKAGDVSNGRWLFDQMPEKNLISWSTMIGGYARNAQPCNALELYKQYKNQGIEPDETFVLGIISACSQLGILDAAESIISDFSGPPLFSSLRIVTSLIDMYAKCGNIAKASQVFKMAYHKDLLCCSVMITAFANHGMAQDAISLLEEMQRTNIKPDGVAFLGVLTACNHGGLVIEGRKYFKQMQEEHGIQPSEKHYACMIDLLGRAGCLEEAYNLIRNMPISPSAVVWGALLAACRVHCNVKLAEIAADELFKIEPNNSGNYILLSNIYADSKRWDGVSRIREIIRKKEVRKNRASSWIELGSVVHEFVTADALHFDSERIYFTLCLISEEMKLLGSVRDLEKEGLIV